jgi:hypothetical protein
MTQRLGGFPVAEKEEGKRCYFFPGKNIGSASILGKFESSPFIPGILDVRYSSRGRKAKAILPGI